MHHQLLLKMPPYDTLVWYGVIFVICLFWMLFTSPSSWLVQSEGRRMKFVASQQHRALPLVVLSWPIAMVLVMMPDAPVPSFIAVGGMILLGIYSAGPDDTLIDGDRWVYERRKGWPWRPRTHVGSLDEIAGVCVTPKNSVGLRFKNKNDWFRIDMPPGREVAVAMAEKVSLTTGLPVTEFPKR